MKTINFLTLAIILLLGAGSSLQAQCSASFSYTNTGNNYNFTASTSAGLFNPIYQWTLYDYNNNATNTITTITPTVNYTFSGGSPFGYHYACLNVLDSITGCQVSYCDSIFTTTNPCAGFSVTHSHTVSGNTVSFTSNITGGTPVYGYVWNFNGLGSSGLANPSFTYPGPGLYAVDLTVYDTLGCQTSYYDSVYISGNGNPCNTSVSFFDSSYVGGTAFYPVISGFQSNWAFYTWDFGNGIISYSQYPSVNLPTGWYNVCLTVDDSLCVETYCDSVYINNPSPCAQNSVTLNLLFDNYATETSWTVTDANGTVVANGSGYSSAMNGQNLPINLCLPTGCYNFNIYDSYGDGICCLYGNGNYSLVDDATGAVLASGGAFAYAETTNFCVGGASNPCGNFANGSFTYSVGANGAVTFTPVLTSNQNPLNYAWDFGNGNVSSSSNPTFTFTNGYHLVCLTADSANCTFTYCDSIMVTTNNGNPTGPCANLTTDLYITQSINDPLLLWMQPVVNGAASNAAFTFVWDFGDNTGAMSGAPLHTYNNFGSYVVCLMALDTVNGCVSTFCDTITVDSLGNFSRNFTKPGFTVSILPPVINYYTNTTKVEESAMTVSLFPNPANNIVNLAISSEEGINGTVSILDLTGKVAYSNTLNVAAGQEQVSLPVEQLPSGVYLVRITSETTQQTMKFIKN